METGGAVEEMEGGGHSSDFRNYKGTENQQKRQREKESPPPTFDQDLKGIEWKNYFMRKIIFFMKDSLLKLSQNKITK